MAPAAHVRAHIDIEIITDSPNPNTVDLILEDLVPSIRRHLEAGLIGAHARIITVSAVIDEGAPASS